MSCKTSKNIFSLDLEFLVVNRNLDFVSFRLNTIGHQSLDYVSVIYVFSSNSAYRRDKPTPVRRVFVTRE